MMRWVFAAVVMQVLVVFSVPAVHADMYRYTDDAGSVCMTNSLESVPKKTFPCRKSSFLKSRRETAILPPTRCRRPRMNRQRQLLPSTTGAGTSAPV